MENKTYRYKYVICFSDDTTSNFVGDSHHEVGGVFTIKLNKDKIILPLCNVKTIMVYTEVVPEKVVEAESDD